MSKIQSQAPQRQSQTYEIAVCEPSQNRVDRVKWPLETVGHTVTVSPEHPNEYDLILLDTPNVSILRYGFGQYDPPVVYRHRGNLWKAHKDLRAGWLRTLIFNQLGVAGVDAVLSPSHRLDRMMHDRARVDTSAIAQMPIDPTQWPSNKHTDFEIRAITLTNADYQDKVSPICEWIPAVNQALETGTWQIAGDGEYADRIEQTAREYENVDYIGFVDPERVLGSANVMLHPSWFDIAAPNAMLEGFASRLPVVTTQFAPFSQTPARQTTTAGIAETIASLRDPASREQLAETGKRYIERNHTPEKIGRDMTEFFTTLIHDSE